MTNWRNFYPWSIPFRYDRRKDIFIAASPMLILNRQQTYAFWCSFTIATLPVSSLSSSGPRKRLTWGWRNYGQCGLWATDFHLWHSLKSSWTIYIQLNEGFLLSINEKRMEKFIATDFLDYETDATGATGASQSLMKNNFWRFEQDRPPQLTGTVRASWRTDWPDWKLVVRNGAPLHIAVSDHGTNYPMISFYHGAEWA